MPTLKYTHILSTIANCPNENCTEKDLEAYRWIHKQFHENDFVPLSIIQSPPPRILDKTDLLCISYGLSLFTTINSAIDRYIEVYNKFPRLHLKEKFKLDKGESVALVRLQKSDGVSSAPKSDGHFTFWEYAGVNFLDKIQEIVDIFGKDGTSENISIEGS